MAATIDRGPRMGFVLASTLLLAVLIIVAYLLLLAQETDGNMSPDGQQRQRYEREFEGQLDIWVGELASLAALAEPARADELGAKIVALDAMIEEAQSKYDELMSSSGQVWVIVRAELERLRVELDLAFESLREGLDLEFPSWLAPSPQASAGTPLLFRSSLERV